MLEIVAIRKIISHMRKIGAYTQTCEVKEAVQAIPKSLPETISAFSNKEGRLIILGLSEKNDFKPVSNFDAQKIYSQLQTIGDQLTPRVRLEIELSSFLLNLQQSLQRMFHPLHQIKSLALSQTVGSMKERLFDLEMEIGIFLLTKLTDLSKLEHNPNSILNPLITQQ